MALKKRTNTEAYNARTRTSHFERYKPYLRMDFECTCAYCQVWESQLGGKDDFHVEHILPKSKPEYKHLERDPSNLLYACQICNGLKSDDVVSPSQKAKGIYYVDPCVEDYNDHFNFIDGLMEPISDAAKHMVTMIDLNRDSVKIRRRKQEYMESVLKGSSAIDKQLADLHGAERIKKKNELLWENFKIFERETHKCWDRKHGYFDPGDYPCSEM